MSDIAKYTTILDTFDGTNSLDVLTKCRKLLYINVGISFVYQLLFLHICCAQVPGVMLLRLLNFNVRCKLHNDILAVSKLFAYRRLSKSNATKQEFIHHMHNFRQFDTIVRTSQPNEYVVYYNQKEFVFKFL